ncbi:MAG: diacylglycerol kinase family lipid kinase [Bacteroidales bacterium]|nr:diacylglycerol kinase family lipid kinase [Bacteroidales bacterium]
MTEQKEETKWAFIINPIAGNGKPKQMVDDLQKQIKQRGINSKIVWTEEKSHASILAKELAEEGFQYIIAMGGDGTLNEMASALVNYPKCTLGLIPAGTGNDFAQIPGMSESFEQEDWDMFFEANIHGLDVGRCNGNLFFNGMGLGFDAQVAAENYEAPGKVKQGGGKSKYIWHILKTLLFFKEQKMIIEANGKKNERICFLNTISIGRRFAGDFYLTPKAYADDGLLDICMVSKINLLQRLSILTKVPKGAHLSNPKVHYYQSNKLTIDLEQEAPYHLDGELFYDQHFEIDILPNKCQFIYNPKRDHCFKNV